MLQGCGSKCYFNSIPLPARFGSHGGVEFSLDIPTGRLGQEGRLEFRGHVGGTMVDS